MFQFLSMKTYFRRFFIPIYIMLHFEWVFFSIFVLKGFCGGVVVGVRHGSSDVFYRGEGCVWYFNVGV